jgi:hypothetical protein
MVAEMAQLGRIIFIIGLIITVVGLFGGFWLMFQGSNDALAKLLLMAVPTGFMIMFAGLSTSVLFSSREDGK